MSVMSQEDRADFAQFLGAYWHDRPETDDEIVEEYVTENHPEAIIHNYELLSQFLESDESTSSKSKFIRREVWWYFPPDDDQAPITWLEGIREKMREKIAEHGIEPNP